METNRIIQGDCLDVLKTLPSESIGMVMTSPPYWALRDYGVDGQLGLEPTFQEYINKLCDIFDEVKRVLKKEGTVWVNMGDTYFGGGNNRGNKSPISKKQASNKGAVGQVQQDWSKMDFKSKCLIQIPSRFAIEMTRKRGYIVKTETDEAWLGGIIEGEGCITIAKHNGYYEPRIQVAMVHREVLDSYVWKVGGSTASKICSDIFDYLISKQEQARIVWRMVEMQKERPRTGGDRYSKVGQKYTVKQLEERERWFKQIKAHNQGNGEPTKLQNPIKNKPWILRNSIIWHKPNCMPSSVKDRFTVDFEKIFFFSKSKKYYFETQYEKYTIPMNRWGGNKLKANGKSEKDLQGMYRDRDMRPNKQGRNKRCVWRIITKPFSEAHFAVYPTELCETPIKAGCPKGGIVLDPFFGAGTTGLVAKKLGRNYLGIELNPEYIKIANDRLVQEILL